MSESNPSKPVVLCGEERIDTLFRDTTAPALASTDRGAIAVVQDLLAGHGFNSMPGLLSPHRGTFGPSTATAVRTFQSRSQLAQSGQVDCATLGKLVHHKASDPRSTQGYMTLCLSQPYSGMNRVLSLVAQMEGIGKFAALNRNTDGAGLSFGLIQWAQRPGRLREIVAAFQMTDPVAFTRIFGGGDPATAQRLLAHVSLKNGGVLVPSGIPTDPKFNLIAEPWASRFVEAALHEPYQNVQIAVALKAFRHSRAIIASYAPDLLSERSVAFMLDVANQFGDRGAQNVYKAVRKDGMGEHDLLAAVARETVSRMPDKFKSGVRTRREGFLSTGFLSNNLFQDVTSN